MSEPIQRGSPDWRARVADIFDIRADMVAKELELRAKLPGFPKVDAACPSGCGTTGTAGLCPDCLACLAATLRKCGVRATAPKGGT